jgi:hypothetical protein
MIQFNPEKCIIWGSVFGNHFLQFSLHVYHAPPTDCCKYLNSCKIQSHIGEHHDDDISLKAFMVTGLNKIFSGRQPRQEVKALQNFKDWLHPWNVGELSQCGYLPNIYWIMMTVFQAVMLWSFIGRNQTRSVSSSATLFLILKLFLKFVIEPLLVNFSIFRGKICLLLVICLYLP